MSGFKPVGGELLYSCYQAGTVSTPTTSPGSSIIVGYPAIEVPPGYLDKGTGAWASSLKFKMGGLLIATATVPTWRFVLYGAIQTTSAPAFGAGGITLFDTGTFTPTATTGATCELEGEIGLRTPALGASSSVVGWGKVVCSALNTAGMIPFPANATSYTPPATWDMSQGYVLWPGLILGAATAGNTFTAQYAKLYGEN